MIALFASSFYIIQVLATLAAYVYSPDVAMIVNAAFSFASVCISLLILRVMSNSNILRNLEWQALVVLLGVAIPECIYLIIDVMLFIRAIICVIAICAAQVVTYMILLNLIAIAQLRNRFRLESA